MSGTVVPSTAHTLPIAHILQYPHHLPPFTQLGLDIRATQLHVAMHFLRTYMEQKESRGLIWLISKGVYHQNTICICIICTDR